METVIARGQAAAVESLRGVVAPHLDYARGGPVYADVYATLKQTPAADRYVILGTNHFGRSTGVAATGKDFLTPLGRVETDRAFIKRLEARLGRGLREHEFDHNAEHSVELQVHFLQMLYAAAEFQIVPVLCHDPCGPSGTKPYDGRGVDLGDFADALGALIAEDGTRTVVIAGADLSHIGQHFGDEQPTTPEFLAQVRASDGELLRCMETRQDEELLQVVRGSRNATRVLQHGLYLRVAAGVAGQAVSGVAVSPGGGCGDGDACELCRRNHLVFSFGGSAQLSVVGLGWFREFVAVQDSAFGGFLFEGEGVFVDGYLGEAVDVVGDEGDVVGPHVAG